MNIATHGHRLQPIGARSLHPSRIESIEDLIAIDARFARLRIEENGCWIWPGWKVDTFGYGGMGWQGARKKRVHRIVASLAYGVPLDGPHFVCHHCDNPPCCNPSHLFIGTARDNNADMVAKGRHKPNKMGRLLECKRGHAMTGDNVAVHERAGRIYRTCRACRSESNRLHTALIREAARRLGLTQQQYLTHYGSRIGAAQRVLAVVCLGSVVA